ncbi:MAG: fasciclin domain-containing protein [Dysgonamonadaceae bacterium]|nr:fasciclin domain-containing protein [Dysgonamonadaceae bacterium]
MRSASRTVLYFFCALFFMQCEQGEDTDKYYDRPEWLEQSIYEVLKQEGRFGLYLQCVDKTEYAKVLQGAGLSTIFAPNDEAFSAYLKEKGYASVDAIPEEELKNLVAYSIVYSKWTIDHLSDYFVEGEYVTGAFKRKTNCYALPYRDPEFDNLWVFDETVSGSYSWYQANYQYRLGRNNYKYLPVFFAAYFNSLPEPLTASDYNTFFPHSPYTGMNVQAGTIVKGDMAAENGIVHEVSTVNEPMKNMDAILKEPAYSGFKSLLDYKNISGNYFFKIYSEVEAIHLDMFQKMRPNEAISKLYIKSYDPLYLAFSPLMENIYSEATGTYDSEKTGNTLIIPQNESLQKFIQSKLLKYYGNINNLPIEVISTLINTHMVSGLVWPSQYKSGLNATGEYINGAGTDGADFNSAGITEKRIAGNGFIYLADSVVKSRFFETVYSEIFLNPAHSMLNRAYVNYFNTGLREELMKSVLNGYRSERYTVLNFSDDLLKADGFTYNQITNAFDNTEMASNDDIRLRRLMRMHVFPGLTNSEIDSEVKDFGVSPITNYDGWGFIVGYSGDLIRYKDHQLQAIGNIEDGTYVTVTKMEDTFNNGIVFNVDQLLQYSPRETASADDRWVETSLWKYLAKAKQENPNVSLFVDYVQACLKNPDTDDLDGIKAENFYTVLLVNNTAMNQAISRGYIRPLAEVSADYPENLKQATQFVNVHFLQGTVIPDDGLPYIYPVNPMSPTRTILPTILKITDEALGLTNETIRLEITKAANGLISFMPQNITLGTRILISTGFGTTSTMRVQRGKVTGSTIPNNFRSNRIAPKAVLHEVNNFITVTLNK